MGAARQMRLTAAHIDRVRRVVADPGWVGVLPFRPATGEDHVAVVDRLMAVAPPGGEVWVFAYGSLIWNPAFDFVEKRVGTVAGWHRAFCLGWDRRFRGNAEQPALMLALDRGGSCRGVVFRLPPEGLSANLVRLVRREMSTHPSPFPARWVSATTASGPVRAISFAINRKSVRYVAGVSEAAIADALATAVGFRGSMAEYLHATVTHLEAAGIHDPYLWRLQEMVAERIERATGMAMEMH